MRKGEFRRLRLLGSALVGVVLLWILIDADLLTALRLRTVEATYGSVETRIRARALLIRAERVVKAPASGRVTLLVNEGRHVRAGDAVLEIDEGAVAVASELTRLDRLAAEQDAARRAELEALERRVREVQSSLRQAEERLRRALNRGDQAGAARAQDERSALVTSLRRLESEAEALTRAREEELARVAERRRELLAARPADLSIVRAPAAGIISFQLDGLEERLTAALPLPEIFGAEADAPARIQDGLGVALGDPLFRVVDPSATVHVALEARGPVPLSAGERVAVAFDHIPERTFPGRLVESVEVDRVWYGKVALDAVDASLAIQRKATATLVARRAEGIVVPKSALIEKNGEPGVYVLVGDKPVFRRVRVLGESGERVAIDSPQGVPVGARVVRNPRLLE